MPAKSDSAASFSATDDSPPSAREIVSARTFNATREQLIAAFSDPQRLAKWWGPNGFTNTIEQFDLRPGGAWHLTMHGPDGTDYDNESVFVEVAPPDRIVYEHLRPMHRFLMAMTFVERDGRTTMTWRMVFDSVQEYAKVSAFVPGANEQNFDRLAEHLRATVRT